LGDAFWARVVLILVAAVSAAACDNDGPTIPTPPPLVTETFNGTVTRNGSQIHSFIATARGRVTATITAVDPSNSPAIGFSMGTWDGLSCTAVMTNNFATTSAVHAGDVVGISSLCIVLFDPFTSVPADTPVNYTVTVTRP